MSMSQLLLNGLTGLVSVFIGCHSAPSASLAGHSLSDIVVYHTCP